MVKDIKITIFNGKGKGKVPFSMTDDNEFVFVTKTCSTLKEAANIMFQQYSLSKPIDLWEPIFKKRRIKELEEYKFKKIYNIAIDLDEINTKEQYLNTIEYFSRKKYSVILGKSKSYNDYDVFNIKGILRVNLTNDSTIIKLALSQMQLELGENCKVDLTVGDTVSYQAPSYNNFIVYYNENGTIIKDSDVHIEEIKESINSKPDIIYDNAIVDKSLEILWSLGYSMLNKNSNDNGSINFEHHSEKKSKGSYFWFASNPFIMNHHNKEKTISIFHIIKDTPEGKLFLKDKTKEEQKNELIRYSFNNYEGNIVVNERYLDFTKDNKKEMINKWLESNKGVLKIKSAMGSAKSSGIELVIQEAHKRNEKVLIVSNRVSVAEDFANKYNIMLYKNKESINSKESLVVQFDSLHRYNLSNYDLVIFDEFISLILHHRSNLTTNANINAVKFKILLDNKRVLIADAFLTGYEDTFFVDRKIFCIQNDYRDDILLYKYKNKEYFITQIINKAQELLQGEHISCSFTSLNVMRVVEQELKDKNIKVVVLSSETSELTREIIYNKFKEDTHNAFDVILFTPTLTVGVSNLNNTPYHFHYDTGMSTDVISSLQMTKRSRTTKEIHYFLEERQFYYDTNYNTINNIAEKNINNFYNKKDKTLLVDVCYETGNLKLTPLARYINQIEVFYNILANNHANAFELLLDYQFKNTKIDILEEDKTFTIRQKVKEVKAKIKENTKKILNQYSDVVWSSLELDDLKNKTTTLTEEEQVILLIGNIQERFSKTIPKDLLQELSLLELDSDFKFISKCKNMSTIMKKDNAYSQYILAKAISEDIYSLQNKSHMDFLEYTLLIKNTIKLKSSYSKNEIKSIDISINKGIKFEKFLKKIGYEWGEARIRINPRIFDFIEYV